MEECLDMLDEHGNKTGVVLPRSQIHQGGHWHSTIHIWLMDQDGRVLIQQRSPCTEFYPNLWNVSIAGHVVAGDSPVTAAMKEAEEELGLMLDEDDLTFITRMQKQSMPRSGLVDNEITFIYFCRIPASTPLRMQSLEVCGVRWISTAELHAALSDPTTRQTFCQSDWYWKQILPQLEAAGRQA